MKVKKWIWIEDDIFSSEDIRYAIEEVVGEGNLKIYDFLPELIEFLVEEKKKNRLNIYGLIVDIMLRGVYKIHIPEEWVKGENVSRYIDTNAGDKAGLEFVRHFVLAEEDGKLVWNPPPPIIFVSVLDKRGVLEEELNDIRYSLNKNGAMEFFNKWDNLENLKKLIKKYHER